MKLARALPGQRIDAQRLVKDVLAVGDIDASVAPGEERLEILNARKEHSLSALELQIEERRSVLSAEKAKIENRKSSRAARREVRAARREARQKTMQEWRTLGVLERLVVLDAPRPVRWVVLTVLASLDYYVFAKAAAVALDIEESFSNFQFWLGGGLGLMVFVCGLLLAHVLKRTALASGQASLVRQRQATPASVPERSSYNLPTLVTSTLFFLAFCILGGAVRLAADTGEQPTVVVFQMLVPLVVVLIEYLMHDPTEVRTPRRGIVDWWLDRRLASVEDRLGGLETAASKARQRVEQAFGTALQRLRVELLDRGFSLDQGATKK